MKIIICGGRDIPFADAFNLMDRDLVLELSHASGYHDLSIDLVIHGGCRGADEAADRWARSEHIPVISVPADWKKYGNAAGPIRNRKMLEVHCPDYVVALPGGKGTDGMIRLAEGAGVPVLRLGGH